jgi:hypothetical protein
VLVTGSTAQPSSADAAVPSITPDSTAALQDDANNDDTNSMLDDTADNSSESNATLAKHLPPFITKLPLQAAAAAVAAGATKPAVLDPLLHIGGGCVCAYRWVRPPAAATADSKGTTLQQNAALAELKRAAGQCQYTFHVHVIMPVQLLYIHDYQALQFLSLN